jgi:hypothetical protein
MRLRPPVMIVRPTRGDNPGREACRRLVVHAAAGSVRAGTSRALRSGDRTRAGTRKGMRRRRPGAWGGCRWWCSLDGRYRPASVGSIHARRGNRTRTSFPRRSIPWIRVWNAVTAIARRTLAVDRTNIGADARVDGNGVSWRLSAIPSHVGRRRPSAGPSRRRRLRAAAMTRCRS